jgi:hypothetical protein
MLRLSRGIHYLRRSIGDQRTVVKRSVVRAFVAVFCIAALYLLNSYFEPHFDFNSFWGAGRALLEGRNPYDYSVIQEILAPRPTANFNYPLFIAVLVVPLGLFDLETAKNIWLLLSEIAFILSMYLMMGPRPRSADFILSTLACAAFVPTLITFFDQQTSMFALCLLSLVYYGLKRDQHVLAGAALAASVIKPQTVALVLLVTLFHLHREGLIAFGATFVSMLIVAFSLMPDWPLHWWASASWITREAGRAIPTAWGLSWALTSQYWLGVLLCLGLLATLLLNTRFDFVLTVGLFLPVYMKPYDLVLLCIPALSRAGRKLLAVLVFVSYSLLFWAAVSGRSGDIFALLTVITLAWLFYRDRALMHERIETYREFLIRRRRS